MNNTMIVGRLVAEPEVKELSNGKKVTNVTLAVPRSYKNSDGEYITDFIDCVLWDKLANSLSEYCKKGDVLGIAGRIETDIYTKEDGSKQKTTKIAVSELKFLSSKKELSSEDENNIEIG